MDNRHQGNEDAKTTQREEPVREHPGVTGVVRPGSDEQTNSEWKRDEGHKVYNHEESTG